MQPDGQSDRRAPGGASSVGDPLRGRLLDRRYRVGDRIARGGMASVYEATDIRLDRTVAVKVMHPGLGDDDEFAARFVREARAAARLSHPNVVAVYDQGDDDGTVFLAMELVAGHTLRDVIRKESPMAPARALALIEPVLSALAAAHRAGLIHRDVKPENVLIATDDDAGTSRVKVADFGLARAVSAETQHTATGGVLIGTVSYLAPELVVDGRADARADVYAAGVVLYELLTGAKPHEGESPIQVAYKHVHEDVPPPSALVPGIPAYVDALVARATARDRELRPADAGVLLHQAHRVSHALAEGVLDDPDLTADLAPTRVRSEPSEAPSPDDTARDPFDSSEFAALVAPADAEHTTALRAGPPPPPTGAPRRPAPPQPRRRSRRGLVILLVALLVASAGGVGAWWFGSGRYISTPGVIGLSQRAAEQKLDAAGLTMELGGPDSKQVSIDGDQRTVEGRYSETVPVGRVLDTDPEAGSRILDGDTVTVTISLGKERYDLPRLKGMTVDQAQDELTATNLAFGTTIEQWSDQVDEGIVIRTEPRAGTTLRPDSAVDLVVSKGPKPVKVKDWTGKDADDAQSWFDERGIDVEITSEEFSDSVDEGDVISQDPPAGSTLFSGDSASLVVSRGPELIEVPSVRAQGVDAATEQLESLGFTVETQEAAGYLGLGFVFSQSPSGGESAPRGSTITLDVI